MESSYKCSCCNCWNKKKDLDHISFSTDSKGNPKQYIKCKNCKKAECLINCNYMPNKKIKGEGE